ncbi:MAG: 5-(carboxyamino)imidazole ribonucleotide synthase [Sphingomonadales bacterium]|nr:5-(carboxyamino)imidazole ribonucleotide synthase [Sphingomonadales bacterium]
MTKTWYGKQLQIGVLGGGQLGRMLIQAANSLDIQLHMLDPDPDAPCAQIAYSLQVGSLTDYNTVLAFGQNKDLITVEIENVNTDALKTLEQQGVKVFPQPQVLELIRDKGQQKQFYLDNQIPTAPFVFYNNDQDIIPFEFPVVHKLRTGGYDGKGVQIIKNSTDLQNSFREPSIIEACIPFEKELSVIVARNQDRQTNCFAVVECEFNPEANLVEFLFSPAAISPEIETQAQAIAIDIIEKLDMVGLLAVEFFLTKDGELLVNEIAPRPHNSGHHTIEIARCSQFEQHLRAILNLPLANTDLHSAGAMLNLIGEKGHAGSAYYEGLEEILKLPGVHPHLYGKSQTKPFRKMGHVTISAGNMQEVRKLAQIVKETIRVISK